ncbi:ribonuclease H-like domain-containing protein [Tanacetum coccineum]
MSNRLAVVVSIRLANLVRPTACGGDLVKNTSASVDLKVLWTERCRDYRRSFRPRRFNIRAMVLLTINDFLLDSSWSGWSGQVTRHAYIILLCNLLEDDMLKCSDHGWSIFCCELEPHISPALFDIMVHLVIHLPIEALEGGPIRPRWMYPFERYMKKLKGYVRNKAKPEGSIAEGYVAEEALTFSSHYFQDVTNGDLFETVYMHQPPSFVDARFSNHVFRLQRSLYGLKQAPRAWFQRFAGYATRAGFYHSRCDSSLFIYRQGSQVAYLLLYVDDIILTASSITLLKQLIDSLHREFDMTDLGALNYFLGISAVRHSTGLFLSQRKYALQLLERAHMVNCNPSRTPVDTESRLGPDGVPVQDPTMYRIQQICLYMHDPREPHLAALKRILRYVQGTLDLGLHLYASSTTSLVGYTDANWAGCPSIRRSTSGYCVFLGDNLLSWSAKRQHTLSRSSAEAEYRGVANVVAETAWLRNLLRELHSPLSTATLVYCDNVSAVYMSANPVQHQRTKHIEIDIHFVRDIVTAGQVRVLHVPSHYQYADIFTKGFPSALFEEF